MIVSSTQTVPPAHPITPISRLSIRDDVYLLLRRGILNHSYPPGHRLDLDELSNQLQVSRTPVKEALHKLETEGLIQILPRRGTFVTSLDAKNIAESYDVRLALECFVIPIVMKYITDNDIQHLRDIRNQMRAALTEKPFDEVIERYTKLDQEFHVQIILPSGNDRLLEIYRAIGGPLQMARLYSKFDAAVYNNYTEPEHDAIMQAIDKRDCEGLKNALTAHVERAKIRVLKLIEINNLNGKS